MKFGLEKKAAFNKLKDCLLSPPVVGHTNYTFIPFELHTNASQQGLGAVLYQWQGEYVHLIAYGSRSNKSERNYLAHNLEFLPLKPQINFKIIYMGTSFMYSRTYVLSSAKLDAMDHRWLASLVAYNFTHCTDLDQRNFYFCYLCNNPYPTFC